MNKVRQMDINSLEAIIKQYLRKYEYLYEEEEIKFIMNNYAWILNNPGYGYLLREIYDYLELIPDDQNKYIAFMKIIEDIKGLNRNIVEVGGGIFPKLAERIALKQKHGNITVFDPRLISTESKYDRLSLKKKKFTEKELDDKCDLLIGMEPYGATRSIIETACNTNTDFIIALGELLEEISTDFGYDSSNLELEDLIYETRKRIRESDLGDLIVECFEDYDSYYPIIYNKRKKI